MTTARRPVLLLTGATSGIGRATAHRLAGADLHLILHGRTEEKAEGVRDEVSDGATAELETVAADLSSLDAVRRLAGEIRRRHDRLDVLVNNAGLAGDEPDTWAVNVVAPFLLAHELRPLLAAAPGGGRVVNVASEAQSPVDLDALPREEGARGPTSYGESKRALVMLSLEMAHRWRGDGIAVVAAHPGTLLDTKMVREHYGPPLGPAEEGAKVLEHLALSEEVAEAGGRYFRQKTPVPVAAQAEDPAARRRLWEITAAMAGLG